MVVEEVGARPLGQGPRPTVGMVEDDVGTGGRGRVRGAAVHADDGKVRGCGK